MSNTRGALGNLKFIFQTIVCKHTINIMLVIFHLENFVDNSNKIMIKYYSDFSSPIRRSRVLTIRRLFICFSDGNHYKNNRYRGKDRDESKSLGLHLKVKTV